MTAFRIWAERPGEGLGGRAGQEEMEGGRGREEKRGEKKEGREWPSGPRRKPLPMRLVV